MSEEYFYQLLKKNQNEYGGNKTVLNQKNCPFIKYKD